MKISILAIGGFLVLICFPLNGQADYLYERGQQNPLPENLPFDANSVIQQIRLPSYPQPFLFCHSECNEEFQYNQWSQECEFLLDTNIFYIPAYNEQWSPSIAFDGTNYLVVWSDYRWDGCGDIFGTRINQSGVVLDSGGIAISTQYLWQWNPSVAFDGINYFVIWQDYRSGNAYDSDIYGARVDQFGSVLDPDGIPVSTAAWFQSYPDIVFNDTNYFAAWVDYRSGTSNDIYGARINRFGVVLDTLGIPICTDTFEQYYVSVAAGTLNNFVVWHGFSASPTWFDIFGARVNHSGIVLDTSGIVISSAVNHQEFPSVAFDGVNYFVVWHDGRNSDIYGARVSQSGVVLDTNGIAVGSAISGQSHASITFNDTNYFVVWADYRSSISTDIYGTRVDPSGVVLDTGGIAISCNAEIQLYPYICSNETDYIVVWVDSRNGSRDIYGTRIDYSGVVLDPLGIAVSSAANDQFSPSVAAGGTNYLTVWVDHRNGSKNIYGMRMDQYGNLLDPIGIEISTMSGGQEHSSVVFNGLNYCVVWQDRRNGIYNSDIFAARINQAGIVLDPNGIPISTATGDQSYPAISFDGTNFLIVWEDFRYDFDGDIYGARISQSGMIIDPQGFPISTAPFEQTLPEVIFDGTNYLVVWVDYRSDQCSDIYGARVTQLGTVLDTSGIAISIGFGFQFEPSVAFNGVNSLVVWTDGADYSNIYGARVSRLGSVLDTAAIPISLAPYSQEHPSVSFDGTNYLVAWSDSRSHYFDIYGVKINSMGEVIDSFPISLQPGIQTSPAVAQGSGDQLLIVYSGWTDSVNFHCCNAMRIWGKFYPFTEVEERTPDTTPETMYSFEICPNPCFKSLIIRINISGNQSYTNSKFELSIKIYDSAGRIVKHWDRKEVCQLDNIVWNGIDENAQTVPAGIYFVVLETCNKRETKKVVFFK